MPRKDTLLGRRFGTITIKKLLPDQKVRIYCSACKKTRTIDKRNVYHLKSCGCLRHDGHEHFIHGGRVDGKCSREWASWSSMKARCTNPKHKDYPNYGGNNPPVRVCDRWTSFKNFLTDLGSRPPGTTLGRFGDVGDYKPGNTTWMRWAEQISNRKPGRNLGGRKKAA
jgi:hypothetical protein